ncbi:hypothetical protein [Agrilutibacter solisilvae]|uniref:Uncharacterized protein n=1 Tax=Agrilutibacter solisilvae TaxID=2763317 RepID=A0A974Y135_9GAMM|nr:hypothetical protein [Lysobacter solisilvae]QSX79466.1 hypothetical protein I8J32_006285 [Lysobacter solisilvae]
MSDASPARLRRAAKTQLDTTVVGIELTLISIIQGLALGVLAASAVKPIVQLQWDAWPYVLTGLLVILIFWSRSLIHTLSFIGWPLEFGHTFLYFGATLIEAAALTQVGDPRAWFGLNALYAAAVWGLYAWDLRVVRRQAADFATPAERALLDDILRDQRLNIVWMMPLAVAFQGLAWWCVHAHPDVFLAGRWHLLLIALTLAFSLNYLHDGVRLLRRRQAWIVERHAQERGED